MGRVVHFEIHADDPERAAAFYAAAFGWQIQKWGDESYWLVTTGTDGPGIDGGILKRMGPAPDANAAVQGYVCTLGVESLDEASAKIEHAGGTNAMPKMAVPTVGWLAYWKDTEGNLFGTMQSDPSAA